MNLITTAVLAATEAAAGHGDSLNFLLILVGLMFATVLMVGVGAKLKLPFPVLMVLLAVGIAFIPNFPYIEIEPALILPLFLPPLLYATAMKTSWSVFRIRWRSILLLAVALVVVTVVAVTGAAWLLIPSIGIPAAIALGAMVSPPDPVAVESVAGRVHMPRRLITVLQSEGLFNDAAAIVIFQSAVAATVSGQSFSGEVVLKFLIGSVIAIALGFGLAYVVKVISHFIESAGARSALTLVAPFAVYLLAELVHASGVIAVIVLALEIRRNSRPHDAAERLTSKSFWEVVELLATGIAFGLIGLEIKHVIDVEGVHILPMLIPALIICAVVIGVRVAWLALLIPFNRHRGDDAPPTGPKDLIVLTWSGMRGLPTLALALSLPVTLADGSPFPARDQIIVTACAVLLTTLVIPGLTLPWLMKVLKMKESPAAEEEAMAVLAQRGQEAALSALHDADIMKQLTPKQFDAISGHMKHLKWDLSHEGEFDAYKAHGMDAHETFVAAQTLALEAAREEVLNARSERGVDPEIADKVLERLDLRTRLIEEGV
jgi:Na+/H+ antiporter